MEISTSINNYTNTSKFNNIMDTLNLDEIETHYGEIFKKIDSDELIYVFQGSIFKKDDNCNLFLKYLIKVIEYYHNPDKQITIILNLENIDKKALNIDFILKFVKTFKKKYENRIILRKFYAIYCPTSFKNIYNFIRPFLHPDTIEKISLVSKKKTKNIEYYYYN